MKKIFISILCMLCALAPKAQAEPFSESQFEALRMQVQQLTGVVQGLKQTVEAQRAEINGLKSTRDLQKAEPPAQPVSEPRTLSAGGARLPDGQGSAYGGQGRWNPDMGAIADVVYSQDSPKSDDEGADRIAVRELELVLGSAVDPYSRLDVTIAFSDFEEAALEEAYYTHFDLLGWGITGRAGRFKPVVGKAVSLHRDSLDTVDEPLVVQHYFGAEGFNKSGADISKDIELPWAMFHRLTFGVLEGGNGEEGTLFGEVRRRPTLYTHLKNYIDLNEVTGLELGVTDLAGSRDEDTGFEVNVLGLDATLIHRYGDQRHVKLQGEAYRVDRKESFYVFEDPDTGVITEQDLDDARHLWGSYLLVDWRFHPQWATGFRFDDVQLIETAENFANPESTESGYTGYLTFYQSEFTRWRLQLTHVDLTDGRDDNRVFVQGTFAIGEHKHKLT